MKRIHVFEFEDFPWFPDFLRQSLTLYLNTIHRIMGTPQIIAPVVLSMLKKNRTNQIVDLCSGGGGAMPEVGRLLHEEYKEPIQLTLSDLYPNTGVANTLNSSGKNWLRYETKPVNAGSVERERRGLRTMICSFHHMPPPVAKKILQDAYEKRQPICIFELTDNAAPKAIWWLPFPLSMIMVFIFTLMVRPFTFKQFFFTYVIPILPPIIAWDGTVSIARTYTESDLKELLKDFKDPDYVWEIKTVKANVGKVLYLTGQNSAATA